MPHTYNNLFPQIFSFQNLFNAYLKARKNKRYKDEVLQFSANLEENLIQLQNELIYKTYVPGRYHEFYVYDPKTRLVMAAPFKDRVLHHAICNIIEPIYEGVFIHHSYACRRGKGTHAGVEYTTNCLRRAERKYGKVYCFKADISKYFQSINHNILKGIIRRKIRCKDTLWLMDKIIDSTVSEGELNPVGLPVGNLTSQLCANIYLNELDYYMKHAKRNEFYVRYMDDFLVIHQDKAYLHTLWSDTAAFLQDKLALHMNHKTAVFPISQGVDFLGYRIWPRRKILRKANVKRIKRVIKKFERGHSDGSIKIEKIRAVLASWLGHSKRANVPILRQKILSRAQKSFGLRGLT